MLKGEGSVVYQAFYRVYRPQSFGEMSGQKHVKQTLQNALLHNKTTHAYLFSGPRGTGKTSAAKIFAKALNCEKGPAAEPCNECPTCESITEGSDTDVIEFDAASNSRVEEMRDIIEKVRFAPSNSRFKIYIIDEVHMLSNSAFNALLKTLEEPPSHAVFILATTEPHKLPLTIISRCQRFDFKPLTPFDIIERMKTVLADAGIASDEDTLKVIAQAASGGMRDALSMLDQVVSFSGEKLTVEDALLVTGSIGEDVFYQLAEALLGKDAATSLSLLNELISEGKDTSRLAEDLITFFRDLLLLRTAPNLKDLLELISGEGRFEELAKAFDPDTLYAFIDILAKTQQEMRFSNHAKVYIESAILKMIHLEVKPIQSGNQQPINSSMVEKVNQLEQQIINLQQQVSSGEALGVAKSNTPASRKAPSKSSQAFRVPTGKINEVLKSATKVDIQAVRENWAGMMQTLQKSHSALLEETEPVAASENAFVLKFKYEIHCIMASENTSLRSGLTNALQSQAGKAYEVIYVPEESWLKVRADFIQNNQLGKQNTTTEVTTEEEHEAEVLLDFVEEAAQESIDPLVTKAENIFGKDFIEVHDD